MPLDSSRLDRLDALRGLALVWMTAYHFCFDLNHFGYIRQNFYADPLWTWQRTGIVSLFLLCAGMGQALAVQRGQSWARFGRRWAQVAGCALLVSVGSWWMFPKSWISFGVLHGMAAMLLIARWLLARGWLRGARPWVAGLVLIAATPLLGLLLRTHAPPALAAAFDSRWLNWLGVVTAKPVTEDYVPLLPWLGVLLWGVGLAQRFIRPDERPGRGSGPGRDGDAPPWAYADRGQGRSYEGSIARRWLRAPGATARGLALLGRWSLTYYMLHQPVLIGALMGLMAVRKLMN